MFVKMKGFVEIDASQDREDIGLQKSDQEFESGDCYDEKEGRHRKWGEPWRCRDGCRAERDYEAGKYLQHRVSGQHIGKETHGEANRPRHERYDFDKR